MVGQPGADGSVLDEARRELIGDLLAALAFREQALAEAEDRVAAALRSVATAQADAASTGREVEALRATVSWRVTRPLRALRRVIGGRRG